MGGEGGGGGVGAIIWNWRVLCTALEMLLSLKSVGLDQKRPMKPRPLLHWKLALIYRHSLPHLSQALYDFEMMALRFSNDGFSYFGPRYLFLE